MGSFRLIFLLISVSILASVDAFSTEVVLSSTDRFSISSFVSTEYVRHKNLTDSYELPEQFYGVFELVYSHNVDAYLICQGFDLKERREFIRSKSRKVFSRNKNETLFNYSNMFPHKSFFYTEIELGTTFVGQKASYFKKHEVTFFIKKQHLLELHQVVLEGQVITDIFEYSIVENVLIQKISCEGKDAVRFFKRIAG